tara:strand:+ start:52 stop:666 length:615 start_codon:yes stop_codon:yes gene_type:complete
MTDLDKAFYVKGYNPNGEMMDWSSLDLGDIAYYDRSKDRHFIRCGGFSRYKCGKYKYWKDTKTVTDVINFLTLEGWVKTEKHVGKSKMWSCPKCSNTSQVVTALGQQPIEITDTAREARLSTLDLIRDFYDKCTKTYKSGESDTSIADVSGMSEQAVKKLRLEWFGELADPDPFEIYNNKLEVLKEEINVMINNLRNEMKESLK